MLRKNDFFVDQYNTNSKSVSAYNTHTFILKLFLSPFIYPDFVQPQTMSHSEH